MAYRAHGLDGLRAHYTGQNASQLTPEQRAEIKARLHAARPLDLAVSERVFWTVSDLRVVVERWYGVVYKEDDSYSHLLRRCGFSSQRTTKVYRHRPSEQAMADFEAELEKKVTDFLQDHPDGQVLALDEMSLYFQATTTRAWSPKGQTPQVRVSGQREHVHVSGAVNLMIGHEVVLPHTDLNSAAAPRFFTRC